MRALVVLALLAVGCSSEKPDETGAPSGADQDGDGYGADADCDDASAAVHPGAAEVCDGLDQDCDGEVDEGATDARTFYVDGDGDGHGDENGAVTACEAPAGTVESAGDCDDADAAFHPGADEPDCADPADYNCDGSTGYVDEDGDGFAACEECDDGAANVFPGAEESCDGVDEDCDGVTDEAGATGEATWYADADGDGYGDPTTTTAACGASPGWVADATDCDDGDPDVNPATTWHRDADGDGHGGNLATLAQCDQPAGYARTDDDCDDYDAGVSPSAVEVCDAANVDEDCDTVADDADARVTPGSASMWYRDGDRDGYGGATTLVLCDAPDGYVAVGGDCDDAASAVHPGGTEVCDDANVDEDCDGLADDADPSVSAASKETWYADNDADGYGDAGFSGARCDAGAGWVADASDCDDARAAVNPGAAETCATAYDDDCDGVANERSATACTNWYVDADGDAYGGATAQCWCAATGDYTAANDDDCDDADADVKPGAAELCDGVDNDCDTLTDALDPDADTTTWYADADEDGYGDPDADVGACEEPDGYVDDASDCDDADPDVNPASWERYGDEIDDDCDGETEPPDYDSCSSYQVPGDYATLSAALGALENTTATICLGAGTHSGTFTFDGYGAVTVQGRGRGVTTLSGNPDIRGNGGTFTLQGMSVSGRIDVSDYFTRSDQRVNLYDLEVDSTSSGIRINRNRAGSPTVWIDGVDIDAGASSSDAGIEIDDSNTTEWSETLTVVMHNVYVHDSYYGVFADMRGTHRANLYLEDSTIVSCTRGVRMYSAYDDDAAFYLNNTVIYGTSTAIDDDGAGDGWLWGRYNALYGNTTNYAGAASLGEGYVTSDPMLDFSYAPPRPMPGSPLVDAGVIWLGPGHDYWGTARGTPDIGAVELPE